MTETVIAQKELMIKSNGDCPRKETTNAEVHTLHN